MDTHLGIVGGGQLGRLMALSARDLGIHVTVLDPTPNSPAGQVADQLVGGFDDPAMIRQLAALTDVLTFEIESADADTLQQIATERPGTVHPTPATLLTIRDKLSQKDFLRSHGIPIAAYTSVESADDIKAAVEQFGYPVVLKARRGGYDGRGNATIEREEDIDAALEKLAGRELLVEQFVPFTKELAVVAARDQTGAVATYPVVETVHKNHICHTVTAPAPITKTHATKAEQLAEQVLTAFGGSGVFGIEMFLTEDGEVMINEIAPRVHNSGHFTLDACATSQFEQHVRAVVGMELGDTALKSKAAVMVNILGDRLGAAEPQGIEEAEALGDAFVHIYGKHETKPERKMGHVTAVGDDPEEVHARAAQARERVTI